MNAIPAQSYLILSNNKLEVILPNARVTENDIARITEDGEVRITE